MSRESDDMTVASVPGLPRYALRRFNFAGVEHFKVGEGLEAGANVT